MTARKVHPLVAQLAEERRAQGITQTEMARRVGVSKTAISEMENGHHEPGMRIFVGYAEALGFEVLHRPSLADDQGYPDEEAMAAIAAACTCAPCMTGGRCIDDPERDEDDEGWCSFCPADCPICLDTKNCDCPTHGGEDADH